MIELTTLVIIALVALGLILGSFANALVWRVHAQEAVRQAIDHTRQAKPGKRREVRLAKLQADLKALSMSRGRSMCSHCRHPLAVKDLVPLFSWLWLRGRCRYCMRPIADTPWLEAGLPVAFVISYVLWPLELSGYGIVSLAAWLIFLTGFAALTVYDIRWYLLPDRIVWPLVGLASALVGLHAVLYGGGWPVLTTALWGIATASGIFWVLYRVSAGAWIGGGDVKLGIVLGLLVGGPLQGLMLIFLASLFGTVASIPLLLREGLRPKTVIPFGPFLMLAAVILVLSGQRLSELLYAYVLLV